jgi:DNA gyrase/topoisomerase IV subunit B
MFQDDFNRNYFRKSCEPQFEGQTKTKLGNREVVSPVSQAVSEMIELFGREPNDARIIVQKLFLQHKHVTRLKKHVKWYNAKP